MQENENAFRRIDMKKRIEFCFCLILNKSHPDTRQVFDESDSIDRWSKKGSFFKGMFYTLEAVCVKQIFFKVFFKYNILQGVSDLCFAKLYQKCTRRLITFSILSAKHEAVTNSKPVSIASNIFNTS